MNAERLIELAALNAAGTLEGADLDEFHDSLANAHARTKAEVARLHDAAALLAFTASEAPSPPASLKARVMQSITPPKRPDDADDAGATGGFYFIGRAEGEWQTLPIPGVRVKDLAEDPRRGLSVKLYELAPGTRFPPHHHSGSEECYVVAGDFHVEGRVLHGGDFHHAEAESDHGESFTQGGCQLLVMVATKDYQ